MAVKSIFSWLTGINNKSRHAGNKHKSARCHVPQLEVLEDRLALAIDLSTPGVELPNGAAIVAQTEAQPTGTGHIKSFLRVQGAASGGGTQRGFNTTARPLQFDENSSPQFTRALTAAEVPVVTKGSGQFREFLLDINQKSAASKLSLDEVRVFLADVPNLTMTQAEVLGGGQTLAGLAPVFNLSEPVVLDAILNHGSGTGDMLLYVPQGSFAGVSPDTYVYLYSKMGGETGASANGGFEEWAVRAAGSNSTGFSSISGKVYLDLDNSFGLSEGDTGLLGVFMVLNGVNDLGETVVLVTTTDAQGNYTFGNLRAGTYTLTEVQPLAFLDGANDIGSAGGLFDESDSDTMVDIVLAWGVDAFGYSFGEQNPHIQPPSLQP